MSCRFEQAEEEALVPSPLLGPCLGFVSVPALTSVLAELEETIGGLAARQRSQRPWLLENVAAGNDPEASSCGQSPVVNHRELTCGDEIALVSRVPVANLGGEIEASFASSELQCKIDSQIQVFDDITNLVHPQANTVASASGAMGKCAGEAFTNVCFLRHSRAVPCRFCGRHFFPGSLRFHEATCRRRKSEELIECPRCFRELRRCELHAHTAKCGKALQRVLQLSQQLEEQAEAVAGAPQTHSQSEADVFDDQVKLLQDTTADAGSSDNKATATTTAALHMAQRARSLVKVRDIERVESDTVPHPSHDDHCDPRDGDALPPELLPIDVPKVSVLWRSAAGRRAIQQRFMVEESEDQLESREPSKKVHSTTFPDAGMCSADAACTTSATLQGGCDARALGSTRKRGDPLLEISALRKKVSQLCEQLGDLPVV